MSWCRKALRLVAVGLIGMAAVSVATSCRRGSGGATKAATWQCKIKNTSDCAGQLSGWEGDRFDGRRIAVLCRSDHPMMIAAADVLVDELAKLPFVDSVEVCHGQWSGIFDKPPRMFVVLDLSSMSVTPTAGGVDIKASVSMRGASEPWSDFSCRDRSVPEMIDPSISGRLEHKSVVRGAGPPDSEFDLPGRSIGEQLARDAGEALTDLLDRRGLFPELPEAIFGSADSTDLRARLEPFGLTHAVTYAPAARELLCYFTFTDGRPPQDVKADLQLRLEAIGFERVRYLPDYSSGGGSISFGETVSFYDKGPAEQSGGEESSRGRDPFVVLYKSHQPGFPG